MQQQALRLSWVFTSSPWLAASILGLALFCAIDLTTPRLRFGIAFIGYLGGLGLVVALVNGICWSVVSLLLRRFAGRFAPVYWLIFSITGGVTLALELNAFAKVHGRYRMVALSVLFLCGVGSVGFGLLCAAFQPTVRRPVGYVLSRGTLARLTFVIALATFAFDLLVADRHFFPNQYRVAHIAMRLVGYWCITMAFVASSRWLPLFRMTRTRWVMVLAGFMICLSTLNERSEGVLQAFDARIWPSIVLKSSTSLVDWDQDGYASLLGDGDCAPFNRSVHPGAFEISDNGIDDNCILGDTKRKSVDLTPLPIPQDPSPLDIVLITVDSLRPDHLGIYNPQVYGPTGRSTTPNLDRWAKNATIFENAYSSGSWTAVVIPSLLRGVFARRLHWRKHFETNRFRMLRKPLKEKLRAGERVERMFPLAFDDARPSVAELLHRRGMHTMALTDDGFSEVLGRGTGIERGFSVFREVDDLNESMRDDSGAAITAVEMISRIPRGKRFFFWAHFMGTHWPTEKHLGTREYGNTTSDDYDHEVAFFDSQIVKLLDAIASGSNTTAVIIMGDHGENITSTRREHGSTISEEVIHIPLFARVPGWPSVRLKPNVHAVDIVPTVLSLTRSPLPSYLDGIDLSDIVLKRKTPQRVLFSDTWYYSLRERVEHDQVAAYDENRKVVFNAITGSFYESKRNRNEVFNLIGIRVIDPLTRSLFGYVEETGGTLDLSY
jgi:hypothetical protein